MKELSLEEKKQIQLQILCDVAEFCEKHNIRYYLSDGSLLGAIRHKGYIPWDDDIDIEMPRPDFIRFEHDFVDQGALKFVAPGDAESRYHNGKVIRTDTVKIEEGIKYHDDYLGEDIDIFVVDGCPDHEDEYISLKTKINKLYNIYGQMKCGMTGSLKHKIKLIVWRIMYGPPEKIIRKAIELCEKYDYDKSKYIARYGRFSLGYRVPADCYSRFEYKEFERKKFRVPIGYDSILKANYGDYMALPPESERITHHTNSVYWKDEWEGETRDSHL